jgi:mRNA interferase RelE/StbE
MTWTLIVARSAQKQLARLPSREQERVLAALRQMCDDPLAGDVKRLRNLDVAFRRRVGAYRILFDLDTARMRVEVTDIERRSDQTYRRR